MINIPFFTTVADYEHVLILLILFFAFVLGLKATSKVSNTTQTFFLDRDYSSALKGIGAVLILMGHYGQMEINRIDSGAKSVDAIVAMITANVALVWFMFISGYGLTVSKQNITNHFSDCMKRLSKVFFPMLFVFLLSLIMYVFMQEPKVIIRAKDLCIPDEIRILPNGIADNFGFVLSGIIRWYWYPWCAMMMYVCFYLADYIACKLKINGGGKTWILLFVLSVYYILAFDILGTTLAHYYRLVWAFFYGHLFAIWKKISQKQAFVMLLIPLLTFYFERAAMIFSFVLALLIVIACSKLNKRYSFNGRFLLHLGACSYFYYLCHRRIVWPLLCSLNCYDVMIWAVLAFLTAWIVKKWYDKIKAINIK